MATKVLVVGWDSAERDVVERGLADGRLPTLARLRAHGRSADVVPAIGFGDNASWASFSTGTELGVHSRSYWARIQPGSRRLRPFPRARMTEPPFWDELTSSGRRVAIVDVPTSPLGEGEGALVVADWMSHALEGSQVVVTWPDLGSRFPRDPDWEYDLVGLDAQETRTYEQRLSERVALRGDVLVDLLAENEWDLFVAVFGESHSVGHHCWHDHDVAHAEHDPARQAVCGDPVESIYREIDTQLARLLDAAGPDAVVVVFSLLGMGTNYTGEHLLDEILRRLEGAPARQSLRMRAFDAGRRLAPAGLRRRAPGRVRDVYRGAVTREEALRSSWVIPTDLATSAIRIGVARRDDGGTVEPGAPLAAYRARLGDELQALQDPETGLPLVTRVIDVRLVHGARVADDFADLMVEWSQRGPITAARSDAIGVVRGTSPPLRTGNHRTRGWMVAAGPGIEPTTVSDSLRSHEFAPMITELVERGDALRAAAEVSDRPD